MLTAVFALLMLVVFGKLAWLALRMTWGLTKVLLGVVVLPLVLVALFVSGLVAIAIPGVLLMGLGVFFLSPVRKGSCP